MLFRGHRCWLPYKRQVVLFIIRGPFIEAKEGISGFIFSEANNLNDAVSIAQTCPMAQSGDMAIEVRPLMGVKDKFS